MQKLRILYDEIFQGPSITTISPATELLDKRRKGIDARNRRCSDLYVQFQAVNAWATLATRPLRGHRLVPLSQADLAPRGHVWLPNPEVLVVTNQYDVFISSAKSHQFTDQCLGCGLGGQTPHAARTPPRGSQDRSRCRI